MARLQQVSVRAPFFTDRSLNLIGKNHLQHTSFADLPLSNSPFHVDSQCDLVSLAWLQQGNILQIAPLDAEEDNERSGVNSSDSAEYIYHPHSAENLYDSTSTQLSTTTTSLSSVSQQNFALLSDSVIAEKSPSMMNTVNPGPHGFTKPNYSYTHLIFMAIESTPQKCMTVNQIYNWCETNFPFYKHAGAGWKNSLRHNLSINKSFKRLPRDNRGPGRGAFWTVEARERATLLDAIKRSPWCFTNSFQAPILTDQLTTQTTFANTSHATTVHNAQPGFMYQGFRPNTNNLLNIPSEFVQYISPSDPTDRLIYQRPDSPDSDSQACNSLLHEFGASCSDSKFWSSPPPSTPTLVADWSQEEEANYLKSMQLLLNSSTFDSVNNGSKSELSASNIEGKPSLDEPKLATKQKRKTRLEPTLVGTCNECKENAEPGCDSCHHVKRNNSLSSVAKVHRSSSSAKFPVTNHNNLYATIANALDSDQEAGPAGGPLVRRSSTTSTGPTTSRGEATSSSSSNKVEEFFVTPAPFVDHEYSHCQAQLRKPAETRIVEAYNERCRAARIRTFERNRRLSKCRRIVSPNTFNRLPRSEDVEDTASGGDDQLSDDYSDHQHHYTLPHSDDYDDEDCNFTSYHQPSRKRRRLNGNTRPTVGRPAAAVRRRRGQRGAGGRRKLPTRRTIIGGTSRFASLRSKKPLDRHVKRSRRRQPSDCYDDVSLTSSEDDDVYSVPEEDYSRFITSNSRSRRYWDHFSPDRTTLIGQSNGDRSSPTSPGGDEHREFPRYSVGWGTEINGGCSGSDVDSTETRDIQTTESEAAQLLLGISQMKNFRRQSGYVSSMDSSLLSSSGSTTNTPVKTLPNSAS